MSDSGKYLHVPGRTREGLLFSMEPIVQRSDQSVRGYELLYRGPRPCAFEDIDDQLLAFLGSCASNLPTLFVNLSNVTMASGRTDALIEVSRRTEVFFELSEQQMDSTTFERIAQRVNTLTLRGVRFALDDFGSGHDGLSRLLAMDAVSVIKIDGTLLRRALARPSAAKMLRSLCSLWREEGLRTVAESIEDAPQWEMAEYLKVDFLQGHLVNATVHGTDGGLADSGLNLLCGSPL